jgi:hypothetical protein
MPGEGRESEEKGRESEVKVRTKIGWRTEEWNAMGWNAIDQTESEVGS